MPNRFAVPTRRQVFMGGTALVGASLLSGCDVLGKAPWFRKVLDKDEDANLYVQRLLLSNQRLAPEFTAADLSPNFKANGTEDPSDKHYKALVKGGFKAFRLDIGGLVERPMTFSLAELRAMPSRMQITRHDCVEGWSCIGGWTGVPLGDLLKQVGLKPQARFIVFYCFDSMDEGGGLDTLSDDASGNDAQDAGTAASGGGKKVDSKKAAGSAADARAGDTKATMTPDDPNAQQPDTGAATKDAAATAQAPAKDGGVGSHYYESIDLEDAFHPQTILAYEMNSKPLPVAHGAPLRLRVERQLGYKMAKYIARISVVETLDGIGQGGGGYWEDQGYEWYAGI